MKMTTILLLLSAAMAVVATIAMVQNDTAKKTIQVQADIIKSLQPQTAKDLVRDADTMEGRMIGAMTGILNSKFGDFEMRYVRDKSKDTHILLWIHKGDVYFVQEHKIQPYTKDWDYVSYYMRYVMQENLEMFNQQFIYNEKGIEEQKERFKPYQHYVTKTDR